MKIKLFNAQKSLPINKLKVRTLIKLVLTDLGSFHQEFILYFVSKNKICALHNEFFQDPSPTDCISFPHDDKLLGEVFVCPQTAIDYASLKHLDVYDELALYIIHGILHCLGMDDIAPTDRKAMRKMEKHCMALMKEHEITLRP